jgi:adenylate cyclase
MSIAIERRFLVGSDDWRDSVIRAEWRCEACLARTRSSVVHVRRGANRGAITVKSARGGFLHREFEYAIDPVEAEHMLRRLCVTPIVEKERHWLMHGALVWWVDVYGGDAEGLVLAEIELDRPDQPFALPRWVSAEVTDDPRYRIDGVARGRWLEATPVRRPRAASLPQLQT